VCPASKQVIAVCSLVLETFLCFLSATILVILLFTLVFGKRVICETVWEAITVICFISYSCQQFILTQTCQLTYAKQVRPAFESQTRLTHTVAENPLAMADC